MSSSSPAAVRLSRAVGIAPRTRLGRLLADERLATLLLFLPPALLLYTLFVILPMGEAAWYSGFNWNGFGRPTHWIGFENY